MNVNTKQMLAYVISVLEEYGITYMDGDDIVRAKKNEQGIEEKLTKLLFDLSILQMFDFNVRLEAIQLRGAEQSMRQVILAHLCEAECPFLAETGDNQVGLNFESSRELLICVGWVLATADIFGRFEEKILMRAVKEIEEIVPEAAQPTGSKATGTVQKPIDFRGEEQSVNALHRTLLSKLNNVECLEKKKLRLTGRIESILKETGRSESLQQLLSNDKSYQKVRMERTSKLIELIEKENKLMRYRKPFWAWMETVVKADKAEIEVDAFEEQPAKLVDRFMVDTNKLSDFMQKCSNVESLYEQHEERFDRLEACWRQRTGLMTDKEKKQLNAQSRRCLEQVNQQIPPFETGAIRAVNSFIGIQLQQMILPDQEDFDEATQDNTSGAAALKQRLVKLCQQNMENLEDLKFL